MQPPQACFLCTSRAMEVALHGLGVACLVGTQVNGVDSLGFTPLHRVLYLTPLILRMHEAAHGVARTKPVQEAVWTLLQGGADVNARDPGGLTPLHFAFVYNASPFLDIVRLLLCGGADVNAVIPTTSEYTPLHFACALKDAKMVRLLIQAGADVNRASKNARGDTPLHISMHADISVALLDAGARLHATDNRGKTALESAKDKSIKTVLIEAVWRQGARRAWIALCLRL